VTQQLADGAEARNQLLLAAGHAPVYRERASAAHAWGLGTAAG
jgi:hypothetical protein